MKSPFWVGLLTRLRHNKYDYGYTAMRRLLKLLCCLMERDGGTTAGTKKRMIPFQVSVVFSGAGKPIGSGRVEQVVVPVIGHRQKYKGTSWRL